jgi:hypothetical protein
VNPFSLLSDNLISWLVQVFVVACLGAALPLLYRIRHPKTQLAFYHSILAICILLPLIEPWQHPLIIVASGTIHRATYIRSGIPWISYVEWVIAAGIVARMSWLGVGLWQIRRYRKAAARLFPIPESIRQARALTRADARFGILCHVDGPATLGYVDPIILLPESFLSLDHDAQVGIACHELLHVKRNDWLFTLLEEIIGAVFWFNPAMWLLLSQTKLSREQLVDSEVVALTASPTPYVHALLAMSGAPRGLKAVPTASFLSDGHLAHRVRALLTKRSGSFARLSFSYFSIAGLLAMIAWSMTVWFPLIGEAQTVETATLKRLRPPILISRAKPSAVNPPGTSTFNVHVTAPPSPSEDAVFYLSSIASGPSPQDVTMLLQPPLPPPFLQPFGALAMRGIRILRPGDQATPEDIARIQSALGDQTFVEVTRADDGTVQKITIQRRRFPDESNNAPIDSGSWSGGGFAADSAGAAGSAHSIH